MKALLYFVAGLTKPTEVEVPKAEEFPGIIVYQCRGFYKVGTAERGTVGKYEECDTFVVRDDAGGITVQQLETRLPITKRLRVTLNNAINKAQQWLDDDAKKGASMDYWKSKEGGRHLRFRRALEVLISAAQPNLNHRIKDK